MKYSLLRFASAIYNRIFGVKISVNAIEFLKNLGYIGIGSGIGFLFHFVFQTQGGRILGPTQYGEYTLIESVSVPLSIPMLVGINSGLVRCTASAQDKREHASIISTTYFLSLVFCSFSILGYFLMPGLPRLFSVRINIYHLSVIFATLFTLYLLITGTLRGLFQMKKIATIYAISPLSLLLVFIFINYSNIAFCNPMVLSSYFTYALISGLILFSLREYLSPKFISKSWTTILIRYSGYGTIGMLSGSISGAAGKLLINHYLTVADLGIYQAYYFASLKIMMMFSSVFITVFFPTASRLNNKEILFQRIKRFLPFTAIFGLPLLICVELIILKFYGKNYVINWNMLLLFAIAAVIFFFHSVYSWFVASFGLKGVKITAFGGFFVSCFNLTLYFLWIPRLGIAGAVLAACVTYLVSLIFFYVAGRYLLNNIHSQK